MKKNVYSLLTITLLCFHALSVRAENNYSSSGCSVAGTASLLQDSICYEDTTMLNLTGYVGAIQWQSFNGTIWNNESGTGATTAAYQVMPGATKQYRAVVTNTGCAADTSNSIIITVGTIPAPTGVGATRCGPGQVTLSGTGNGTLQWFAAASGGSLLGTGSPFNVYAPGNTTFYLSDNTDGGSGGSSALLVTEMEVSGDDFIEIQNVSNQPLDVTGWKVVASNDYGNINTENPNIQILSGIMQPGDIKLFADNTTTPNSTYWGSNLLFNPGAFPTFTGWVMILDSSYAVKEFLALNWPEADIFGMTVIINGVSITIDSTKWNGNGVDITSTSAAAGIVRQGNIDVNSATDFSLLTPTLGSINSGLTLPFLGFGCSSPRIPVDATVTSAESVVIAANPPALCLGQSSTLSASSINGGYAYTWSPSTGLSTTTGNSVTATPSSPISYIVIGDDGICSNRDTVFINVGPISVAGIASVVKDTICLGDTTTLSLAGSVGSIQWQSNTGGGWVNETGTGSNASSYTVNPTANTQYQAIITSAGCDADSSSVLALAVLTITNPTVSDTTVCANSTVTLSANGAGVVGWYSAASNGYQITTGNTFTANVIGDTTFYAASKGGVTFHSGALTNAFGSSNQSVNDGYGLGFDVSRACVLEQVYVYTVQAGNVTINLRASQGGTILQTVTQSVVPSATKVAINLGWALVPFNGYRLEIAGTSVPLKYNFSGASYPYVSGNSPLTITGFLSPFFNTGVQYFYFYDWVVFEGCTSALIPLNVTTTPAQPIITQNFSLLTSSATSGNQWYLNGNLLSGETGQTLTITQTGLYSVTVTSGNCTASASINITAIGIDELQLAGIAVYPNPVKDMLTIRFENNVKSKVELRLSDAAGAVLFEKKQSGNINHIEVNTKPFAPGTYLLEIKLSDGVYRKTVVKN